MAKYRFVNYVKHIKNKSYFEVQVSKEVLPYYVELAQNFTSYSMTVAIALKSTFSQRFTNCAANTETPGSFLHSRKASGNVHVGKEIQTGMRFQKACT